jgi:hypothetical protein
MTYAEELKANQAKLNEITPFVKVELQKLGIDCALDMVKSDGNPDAMFITCPALHLNIRAHIIGYGGSKGRIEWHGYAHIREHHLSDRPSLGITTSAADASAKRIAGNILRNIIEPAAEPVARYNRVADEWDAHRAALPEQMARVENMGFQVAANAGATEAHFYVNRRGVSGRARINSNGSLWFDQLSLDAETARCVLEFLAARPKD